MAQMSIRAFRFTIFCGAVLFLWLTAAIPSIAGPCTEQDEAPGIFVPDRGCFNFGIGYQYQHFKEYGSSFHDHAYNFDFGMHLLDLVTGAAGRLSVGVEGAAIAGFDGHTGGTTSQDVKTFFVGAGPHVALQNNSRFEPWVHGLVGVEHLRFTQSATLGSNSALGYQVGGGVDIRLTRVVYWRFQGDYVGTDFQSTLRSNYSAGAGVLFYF